MESIKFLTGEFFILPVMEALQENDASYELVCGEWELFGRSLHLVHADIAWLKEELRLGRVELRDIPREILRRWKDNRRANLKVLYEALKDVDARDLAESVREKFGGATGSSVEIAPKLSCTPTPAPLTPATSVPSVQFQHQLPDAENNEEQEQDANDEPVVALNERMEFNEMQGLDTVPRKAPVVFPTVQIKAMYWRGTHVRVPSDMIIPTTAHPPSPAPPATRSQQSRDQKRSKDEILEEAKKAAQTIETKRRELLGAIKTKPKEAGGLKERYQKRMSELEQCR